MAQPAARVLFCLPLCVLFLISTTSAFAQTSDEPYVASELILSFGAEADLQQRQEVLEQLGATSIVQFSRIEAGLYRLESMTVDEALELLDGNPYLALAEPNYILYEHAIPDDPRFDELWGMHNTGQTGGTPGADISAVDAWNVFTGSREVVVGVIDTGLDMSHPDIADNVFVNEGEIPGNGIDDDGNGFIDDVNGWDFANNDNNPFDDRGHGTHVSGTIGGVGNNGVGVAGVNWSVRILPIKFLRSDGSGTTAAAVQAVEYATLMGVDLTNNSWGGGGFSTALLAAIEDADAAGIHFVASSGNSGRNTDSAPSYPASYDTPNIISVAATNHHDQLAGFSNYGAVSVDLGAPGVNILSSVPGGGYSSYDGTSMAAPHVAGVVALMVGRFPEAPHDAIKQRLLTTADPVPALAGRTVSGARLNAFMAITDPDETPPAPVNDLQVVESGSNWLRVAWSATGDDGAEGTAVSYEMRRAEFPLDQGNFDTGVLVDGLSAPLPSGTPEEQIVAGLDFLTTYWFALVARDEFGNTSLVSNSASGVTLGIPTASVSPTSLSEALLTGASSTQGISLSNTGEGTLDFVFGPVEYLVTPETRAVASAPAQPAETYLAQYDAAPLLAEPHELDPSGTPEGFSGRPPSTLVGDYFEYLQSVVDGAVIYSDDMENGAPGWSHAPTTGSVDQWALVSTRSASGSNSWNVAQHSGVGSDALYSPIIDLPSLPELRLAFEHWYNFDDCGGDETFEPDGGIVEVSADDGLTWTQIFPLAGYPYVLDDICGNPLAFFDAYSHDGGEGAEFIPAVFDLSEFAGAAVILRFHAGWDCGNCEPNEGWYIDDVTVFAGIPPWLGVDLVSGSLSAGETAAVGVNFNAAGLFGGLHAANLVIGSNDPVTPEVSVPVQLIVTGAPDIEVSPSGLDFGTVFVDGSERRTLRIENAGTDVLDITSIVAGDAALTISVTSMVLGFGESGLLEVTYAPSEAVDLSAEITLVSNDPDEGTMFIPAVGSAVDPPVIAVSPTSVAVDLFTGETASRIVTVSNDGTADLELEVLMASEDESAASAYPRDALERFGAGFSAVTSTIRDPFAEASEPAFANADPGHGPDQLMATTPIGGGFSALIVHAGDVSQIQSLLLAFPDIDVVDALDGSSSTPTLEDLLAYDTVILAPNSQFTNKAVLGNVLADYVDAGGGVIETTPAFVDGRAPEGRWLAEGYSPYELGVGPLGVADLADFDASHPLMEGVTAASVALCATATLRADAIWVADLSNGEGFVATNDRGVVAINVFVASSGNWVGDVPLILRNAVAFATGGAPWLSVDPTTALIPAGQAVEIELAFDAAGLIGGVYSAQLELVSNDPVRPRLGFPVTLSVTGAPDIEVDPLALDFGEVFVGGSSILGLEVQNVGTDVLTVGSITSSDPDISSSVTNAVLGVAEQIDLDVQWAPSSAGPLVAVITLASDDPDEPGVAVTVVGTALDPPDLAVNPSSLESDLFTGEIDSQTLTLSNDGVADLVFNIGAFAVEGILSGSPEPLPMTFERTVELGAEELATPNGDSGLDSGLERAYGTDPSVLVYTDNLLFPQGDNVVEQALHRLGLAYVVEYRSPSNFNRLLTEGTWDLVIVDNSLSLMDWAPVEAYVVAGGAVIISYWDIDGSAGGTATIWANLGVDHAQETFDALPVYRWETSHALFNQPNVVPDFTRMVDTVYDNGDKFDALGRAEVIAGFSTTATAGEGGLLISGDYPAIVHGFLPGENEEDLDGDSILDAVELYENEIRYLLRGASWLTIEPEDGTLGSGETIDLAVSFDASGLIGGSYPADIVVSSNDPDEPEVTIPTQLTVTGAPDILVTPLSLDFGELFVGNRATGEFTVENLGTDVLGVTSIAVDNADIGIAPTGLVLAVGEAAVIEVEWTPSSAGALTSAITVASDDPDEPAVEVGLAGIALDPPDVAVNPGSLESDLFIGDIEQQTLTISNEGVADLVFSLGTYAVEGHVAGSAGSLPMTSQRTVALSAEDGVALNGDVNLATGLERVYGTDPAILVYTDNILRLPGDNVVERALHRLGLSYTAEYGSPSNFIRLLVTGSWDLVIIDDSRRVMFFPAVEDYVLDGGALIVSYWDIDGSAGGPATIWETLGLDHASETFNALPLYRWDTDHTLFNHPNVVPDFLEMRDTVNDNGDRFDAIGTAKVVAGFTPTTLMGQGGVLVSSEHSAIVHGFLPGENAEDLDGDSILDAVELYENEILYLLGGATWLGLEPLGGTIAGGQSLDVNVTFDATNLLGGTYAANIVVSSNDPDEAEVVVPTLLTATGIPRIAVTPANLDFGWLYLTQDRTLQLEVSNPGSETLEVTGVSSNDPEFSVDLQVFDVAPGRSQILEVTFAAVTPGTHDAELSIVHNAAGSLTAVPMTALGIVPPEIVVTPSAIEAAAAPGGQKTKIVTICNDGGSDLEFRIGEAQDASEGVLYDAIEFAKQADEEGSVETVDPRPAIRGTGGPDRFGYTWVDSDDPGGPVFDWVDISGVGTPVPFPAYLDDGNVGPIPIGFNFFYYGEAFSEINVCSNGWLSFTNGSLSTYSNQPLPNRGTAVPENMLAPLWDDLVYDENAGNYAYYHYDGTRFIAQFELRHIAVFTPPFYEFQVILYPDGRIVYQYNSRGLPIESCTIGIQNGTKDDGLTVAFSDQSYLHDELAIEFSSGPDWLSAEPASGLIAPGECVDVAVTLDATELESADYTGDLTIASNDITDPIVEVPLLFHVGTIDALVTDAEPNTLNVTANGMHMAAYVELPEGYDPTRVLLESVKLNGAVVAEPRPFSDDGDFNENGIPDLMFKFDRTACAELLEEGEDVEITITGEVEDTTWFVATDYIRVINPQMTAPDGGEYAIAGSSFPITWLNPVEWHVSHADLFWTADDGETWLEIARNVPGSSYDWTVPGDLLTEDARVRVFVYDEQGLLGFDTSEAAFHIVNQITSVAPNVRPKAYALGQNVPNPFNPRTTISFDLPRDENVRIGIYDVKGRLVKTLVSGPMTWGRHEVVWDGVDSRGNRVATGVYYYRIVAGSFQDTRNMVLVK